MPTVPKDSPVLSEIEQEQELPPSVALSDADTGGQAVPEYVLALVEELEEIDRRLADLYSARPLTSRARPSPSEDYRRNYERRELDRRRAEIKRLIAQFLPLLPPEMRYVLPYDLY